MDYKDKALLLKTIAKKIAEDMSIADAIEFGIDEAYKQAIEDAAVIAEENYFREAKSIAQAIRNKGDEK